ncbi:MAG: hypothetical protein APR63_10430 [Desulfuromonas sp. SDB]|nr:MAG: hypothetical protein APR63_10430 [Desulfuromonas sp. SDB]
MKDLKIHSNIPLKIGFIAALFVHIAALVAIPEPNISQYQPADHINRSTYQQDINLLVDFQTIDEVIHEIHRTDNLIEDPLNNSGDIVISDSGDTMISSIYDSIFSVDTTSLIPEDTVDVSSEYVETYEIPPQPIFLEEPEYPTAALNGGMEGTVILYLYVDIDGTVNRAEVINSTNPIFNDNAIQAGLNCRFKPAESAGRPVRVKIVFPVNFKLN